MNPAYLPIFYLWLILFITSSSRRRNNQTYIINYILNKSEREKNQMLELAKKFIEKECVIYTFEGNQYSGTVKEVSDGALLVERKGVTEAINLNFVVRIREIKKK